MKSVPLFSIALLSAGVLLAQDSGVEDYTRWNLPEGASHRLGKGRAYGVTWWLDGTRLAVVSSLGIWLYDAATGQERIFDDLIS